MACGKIKTLPVLVRRAGLRPFAASWPVAVRASWVCGLETFSNLACGRFCLIGLWPGYFAKPAFRPALLRQCDFHPFVPLRYLPRQEHDEAIFQEVDQSRHTPTPSPSCAKIQHHFVAIGQSTRPRIAAHSTTPQPRPCFVDDAEHALL